MSHMLLGLVTKMHIGSSPYALSLTDLFFQQFLRCLRLVLDIVCQLYFTLLLHSKHSLFLSKKGKMKKIYKIVEDLGGLFL